MRYRRKKTISKILTTILICFVALGTVIGVTHMFNKSEEGRTNLNPKFTVGGLSEDGTYVDTDKTIYTKNAFECEGLEVKLDFEATIKYQVYYYDENDTFIEKSPVYNMSAELTAPENAKFARIVVEPIWGDDVDEADKVCHWYDIYKYTRQIEISVADNTEEPGNQEDVSPDATAANQFLNRFI